MEIGNGVGDSGRFGISGDTIMSSTSNSSSSSSSAEQSQANEFITLLSLAEDGPKSTGEGMAIEAAEAGGGLARKNGDDENGSHIELSTTVCIADCAVSTLPS